MKLDPEYRKDWSHTSCVSSQFWILKDINQTNGLVIDMMSPIPHVNPSFMLEVNGTVHY